MNQPESNSEVWKRIKELSKKDTLLFVLAIVGGITVGLTLVCATFLLSNGLWTYVTTVLRWDHCSAVMVINSGIALLGAVIVFVAVKWRKAKLIDDNVIIATAAGLIWAMGAAQLKWHLPREVPYAVCLLPLAWVLLKLRPFSISRRSKPERIAFFLMLIAILAWLVKRYLAGENFLQL